MSAAFLEALHDNRFRTYDPAVGRYISADPIGQESDLNVYRYALANPINNIDPEGLWVFAGAGATGGTIVAGGAGEAGASGVGAAVGAGAGAGLAIGAAAAAGYGIGTLIEPYVSPYIEPLIDSAAKRRKGGWVCHVNCNLQWDPGVCPTQDRVSGTGYGSSVAEAWKAAIHDATQCAPRDSYPRHCKPRCSKL